MYNNGKQKILKIFLVAFILVISFKLFPQLFEIKAQEIDERLKGKIVQIIEEKEISEDTYFQKLEVKLDENENITIINDPQSSARNIRYKKGDKIILSEVNISSNEPQYVITDYNRQSYLIFLFILFAVLSILIARKRGFYSLLGMFISFLVIFKFILPQIAGGKSPFLISIMAALFLIPITFYLSHGFNKKTHISIFSTILALIISAILATLSISAANLTGYASEEARFLQIANQNINMRGILLAGIIIGFLGILDDVTVSQANIVLKLKQTDPNLGTFDLYKKAMDIGRDHISSMINTLVLVYAGASLPLLLLFIDNPEPFLQVINREIIADEIIRTLIGSIGLIIAVPLTTFFSSLVADTK